MDNTVKRIVIDAVLESATTQVTPDSLEESVRFYELGIDSISMLSILLRLEERLSLNLDLLGDEVEAPSTLGDLFKMVASFPKEKNQAKTILQ